MYNIGHDIYYLDYQFKETDQVKCEFACQTRIKNVQKICSYFVIEFPSEDISNNDQKIKDQNNHENNLKKNLIAFLFYSNFENFNEYLKQIVYQSLTTSIYFKNRQYFEAFESCLDMLQNSFQNSELINYMLFCQQKTQKSLLFNLQQQLVSINAIMRLQDDYYFSKSLKNYDKIENMLYIQRQGFPSVKQLIPKTDFENYSEYCFKIKQNIIQPDDILILTDSLTLSFQKIFSKNLKSQYPLDPKKVRFGNFMHLLKIQVK